MIAHRCHNCMWWDNQHPSVQHIPVAPEFAKQDPGFCRKHRPSGVMVQRFHFGIQPVMDADEFCGEFRKEQA